MKRLILIPLLFLFGYPAMAASPVIVDDIYVAEAIARNAVVWDVRSADAYARGHIAGSVNIGDAPRVLRDDNTEDFIATDRIEKILGAAGLDPRRETIIYGSPRWLASLFRSLHVAVFQRQQCPCLPRRHRGLDRCRPSG